MAMTNAERQKNYRQRKSARLLAAGQEQHHNILSILLEIQDVLDEINNDLRNMTALRRE